MIDNNWISFGSIPCVSWPAQITRSRIDESTCLCPHLPAHHGVSVAYHLSKPRKSWQKKNNVDMISYGLNANRVCIYIYNPPWPANVWPGNMSEHHLSSPSKTSNVSLQKFPSERCDRRLLLSPPPSIHDGKIWQLCQGEVSENALPADFPGCFLEIFLTRHRFLSHILQFLWSKLERTHVAFWCPKWHDEFKKGFCCFFASNFS